MKVDKTGKIERFVENALGGYSNSETGLHYFYRVIVDEKASGNDRRSDYVVRRTEVSR